MDKLSSHPASLEPSPSREGGDDAEVRDLAQGKRADPCKRAQRLIVEDAPWLFVDHEVQVVATRANVKGFRLHPSGFDLRVEHLTR